jgi:putative endonuclease
MGYVYFLRLRNGDIYVGSSKDLKLRLVQHKTGQVNATKSFLPVRLIAYIAVSNERKARELEKYFKSGSGRATLRKRIIVDGALPDKALANEVLSDKALADEALLDKALADEVLSDKALADGALA